MIYIHSSTTCYVSSFIAFFFFPKVCTVLCLFVCWVAHYASKSFHLVWGHINVLFHNYKIIFYV